MTFDSLGSGDYHSDGTNLYKGNYNLNSNNQTIDDFKKEDQCGCNRILEEDTYGNKRY